MEHPLISSLGSLTIDELSNQISELNKKLGIAQRMGNGWLCDQLRMALENYQNQLRVKTDEALKKGGDNYNEIINIS